MKKNNGFALAYTIAFMALIFALCLCLTTLMLVQLRYSGRYKNSIDEYSFYEQLGQKFIDCAELTALEKWLSDNGFYCETKPYEFSDGETAPINYIVITNSELSCALNLDYSTTNKKMTITRRPTPEATTVFTVEADLNNTDVTITKWTYGG